MNMHQMLLSLRVKQNELEEAHEKVLASEIKKKKLACDIIDSMLEWLVEHDHIDYGPLKTHRDAVKAIRK